MIPNPGQPTIREGDTSEAVRHLQRALCRTPHGKILTVDGIFGMHTQAAVKPFQVGASLVADGLVGPLTWRALPDGGPMPVLAMGSTGDVVRALQIVLTNRAPDHPDTRPHSIDGDFGPHTRASVEAFQESAGVEVDGVVGEQTWAAALYRPLFLGAPTLESAVGLGYVMTPPPKSVPRPGWALAVCTGAIVSLGAGLWLYMAKAPKIDIVAVELGGRGQTLQQPVGTYTALAWDYALILGYGLALWLGTTAARWVFWSQRATTLARLSRRAAVVVVAADLIENLCLTVALNSAGQSPTTVRSIALDAAAASAVIKFTVLVPVAVMAVLGVAITVGRLLSGTGRHRLWDVNKVVLPVAVEHHPPDAPALSAARIRRAHARTRAGSRHAALHSRLYQSVLPAPPYDVLSPGSDEPRWRRAYAVPGIDPDDLKKRKPADDVTGFCLSGGGIRSASVAMGALQTLRGDLRKAKYLVSISGGGYTSGALAMLLTGASDPDFVPKPDRAVHDPDKGYGEGSVEVDHVRRHSSYLATTATQMLVALAVLARGLLATLLLLFSAAVAIGVAVAWFYRAIPLSKLPDLPPQRAMVAVAVVAGLALLAWLLQIFCGSSLGSYRKQAYRWFSRASVFLTQLAGITAVIAVGIPTLVWACANINGSARLGISGGGSLGSFLLTYLASIASIAWRKRKTILEVASTVGGKGTKQKAAIPNGLLQLLLVIVSVGALCLSWLMLIGVTAVGTAGLAADKRSQSIILATVATIFVIMLGGVFDESSLSLHPFYRRRLASAFATRTFTGPGPESESTLVAVPYHPRELTPLSKYARPAETITEFPEFIFACAAHLTGEDRTPPGLTAVSFTMSADWVGGPDVGWVDTATLEKYSPDRLERDLTVQGAMAISGAAFASAMGRFARWYQIVLAVSGARLGAWLPNPTFLGAMRAARDERGHVTDWTLPGLPRIRRGTYLLRELFNIHPQQERLLHVTDGGHYENLGIVELLRRRCTTIYCIDGGGDSPPTAAGLAEAIALAETELGVRISLNDPFAAEPGSGRPLSPDTTLAGLNATLTREPVITGRITYPAASGLPQGAQTGIIYVARALLWPDMPYSLLSYAAQHPVFPHDSTGDQWFNDGQFTAYSDLGRELGSLVQRVRSRPTPGLDGHAGPRGMPSSSAIGVPAGNGHQHSRRS